VARNGQARQTAQKKKSETKPRKIKLPNPEQMEKIAKRWEPYRSVACWYLWQSLDIKTM
jgi:3-methyladenine DNA glycosylase/8-oxoguanine DNA glycosylase